MEDFPCWQFLLRDSLALQHEEKIILSLCVSVRARVRARARLCVFLLASGSERKRVAEWTDRLCVRYSLASYVCKCVLLPNRGRGSHMSVCSAAACVEVYSHISPTV